MGLLDRLKAAAAPLAKAAADSAVPKLGQAPSRLPEARPGTRCRGGAYFEDNTGRMPLGRAEVTIRLENSNGVTPQRLTAPVSWNGKQIGWMDGLGDTPYAELLRHQGGMHGVYTATAEVTAENVAELNGPPGVRSRHVVRLMVPTPGLLEAWFKASPADRASLKLDTVTVKAPLKESKQHQEALQALHRRHGEKPFAARIEVVPEPSGKYKGQDSLVFTSGKQTLGRIPARYREQHEDVFDTVLAGTRKCEVAVRTSSYGEEALYAVATLTS